MKVLNQCAFFHWLWLSVHEFIPAQCSQDYVQQLKASKAKIMKWIMRWHKAIGSKFEDCLGREMGRWKLKRHSSYPLHITNTQRHSKNSSYLFCFGGHWQPPDQKLKIGWPQTLLNIGNINWTQWIKNINNLLFFELWSEMLLFAMDSN